MLNKVKKLFAILLILIYTSTALGGFIVNFHYCKGHLSDVSLLNFAKAGCACNPDSMPKDCCKDELFYKKTDNHRTVQESYILNTIPATPDLPPLSDFQNQIVLKGVCDTNCHYNDVSRSWREPIYLLNRVFRI